MRKTFVFAFWAFVAATAASMDAQQRPVDHWKTKEECLAANSAPFYYPSVVGKKSTRTNEVIMPHPTGGCFEMDLPDRLGGRGWVRIEQGRLFVYDVADTTKSKVIRFAECDNTVYAESPFGGTRPESNPFNVREGALVTEKAPPPSFSPDELRRQLERQQADIDALKRQPPPAAVERRDGNKKAWVIGGVVTAAAVVGLCIWKCPFSVVQETNVTVTNR